MIQYVNDDLYNHIGEYDVILVGTNLYCTMSQGFQLKVMLNYPYVQEENMKTKYGDMKKLGTIQECKEDGEQTFCLCFITVGYNFRPDLQKDYLSYDALENCLKLINVQYKGEKVACALLGSSRFDGNGDIDRIKDIFEKCTKNIDLTVYLYEQLSRSEEMKQIREKELEVKKNDKKKYYLMVSKRKKLADERFKKNKHRRY